MKKIIMNKKYNFIASVFIVVVLLVIGFIGFSPNFAKAILALHPVPGSGPCQSPEGNSQNYCAGGGSSYSLTASSPSCIIPAGSGQCNVTLTWAGVLGSKVYYFDTSGNLSSSIASGTSGTVSVVVPYSSRQFVLLGHSSSTELDSTSVLSTCTSASTWNASSGTCTCVSGTTLSGGSCVATNENCSVSASFTATPINCVGSWGACSNGSQTYNISTSAANGGSSCSFSNGATQACGTNGGWSGWSPTSSCPTTCGLSASTLTRSCTAPTPANGGKQCTDSSNPNYDNGNSTQNCAATAACTCSAPLTQTVTVPCDLNAYGYAATSGSVTRRQTKSAYPSCAFGTPVTTSNSTYSSDTCVYPPPTPNLTIASTWGITDGSQSGTTYVAASYTVSWGAVANATSCTLDGTGVATSGGTSTGTANWASYSHTFTLSCTGPGGTGSSTATIDYPPPPTNVTASCPAPGTTATLSWTIPSGYSLSYFRANDTDGVSGNKYTDGNLYSAMVPEWTPSGASPFSFSTTPGHTYSAWVLTKASDGAWSQSTYFNNFTCANPLPVTTISADSNPIAYGTGTTIRWPAETYATSCSLQTGSTVLVSNASVSGSSSSPYTTPALTANTQYTIYCNNSAGTTNASVTVSVTPMTGSVSLSPATPNTNPCTIAAGASTCNVNLSWSTTHPTGTSQVTSPWPSAGTVVGNGNNGGPTAVAIPYGTNSRTFYLYNSGYQLAQQSGSASCADNTTWNGSTCAWNQETLTINKAGTGGGTVTGAGTYDYGSTATATESPSTGSYFAGWSGDCSGSGTNSTASVTMNSPKSCTATFTLNPINGACSVPSVHYTCKTGTSVNWVNGQGWTWDCNGSNGGTNATGCKETIPPPTNVTASCPAPGTTATLSWTIPSGYTLSYVRANDTDGVSGTKYTDGNLYSALAPEWNLNSSSPFSFSTTPGHTYSAWVYTRASDGSYSAPVYFNNFTCAKPTASFTNTPSCTIPAGKSGCAANITWTSSNTWGVNLTDGGDGVYSQTNSGAQSSSVYIPYNSGTYNIRDVVKNSDTTSTPNGVEDGILATVTGSSSCASGSWSTTSNTCPVVVSVTASPLTYNTTPSTNVNFAYTATTNSSAGTECRLLDNTQIPLGSGTYQSSSPIVYASASSVGQYGYYIQCRDKTTTIATTTSNQVIVNVSAVATLPTVTTALVTNITQTTATGNENVTSSLEYFSSSKTWFWQ